MLTGLCIVDLKVFASRTNCIVVSEEDTQVREIDHCVTVNVACRTANVATKLSNQ